MPKQKRLKQTKTCSTQTDKVYTKFDFPPQAANIIHYKPQELIRMEVEFA